MKLISYLIGLAGIIIGVLFSVRVGALTIAAALAVFVLPDFRQLRTSEKIIPAVLFVSLITIALALPRR
ncbi:MAG: hypothetical protein EBS03_03810 [Actinobacteria bacterium]|jgi:hypothetical protein|nr:hypothetical protein [Actinomycetota bacterium]